MGDALESMANNSHTEYLHFVELSICKFVSYK